MVLLVVSVSLFAADLWHLNGSWSNEGTAARNVREAFVYCSAVHFQLGSHAAEAVRQTKLGQGINFKKNNLFRKTI